MVFNHLLPKPHAHKTTIKIFNIKHSESPYFWVFQNLVILRYTYRVKTCKLFTLGAYINSTHQPRSAEKKHLPEKV